MTLLAELTSEFPWGVLLLTDVGSKEQIPEWASPEDQVTSAASALVVRVRHGDEGPVTVRVWSGGAEGIGEGGLPTFEGTLRVESGVLRVSNALGEEAKDIPVPAGQRAISIFADEPVEATVIDVVLR